MTELANTPEFRSGWDAAIRAVQQWHQDQAQKALVLSRRTRFPKNLERDAELHKRVAELIAVLSPDDV